MWAPVRFGVQLLIAADIDASNLSQERKIVRSKSDLSAVDLTFVKAHHRAHMHARILVYCMHLLTRRYTQGKSPGRGNDD